MQGILLGSCKKQEMPMADMIVYGSGQKKHRYRRPFIDFTKLFEMKRVRIPSDDKSSR
jgi:hypothetical protein